MRAEDLERLSWTVRHDRPDGLRRELLDDLLQACRDACAAEFLDADGYATSFRRLSGALEGVSIEITRTRPSSSDEADDFWALVSVQHYLRAQEASAAETRIVASCRHGVPRESAADGSGRPRSLARLEATGCALGTVGLGAFHLEPWGILATWSQALLLIPALVAWRLWIALRSSSGLRDAQANRRLLRDAANAHERIDRRARDRERWRRLTEFLLAQRDALAERSSLRPFRSPGRSSDVRPRVFGTQQPLAATVPLRPPVLPVPA